MNATPPFYKTLIILGILLLALCPTALASSVTSLSVGGVDILVDPGSSADPVYFDSATDTLTLTDANVGAISANADALKIVLSGSNSVTTTSNNSAINLRANTGSTAATLTISGGGSLHVMGGKFYGLVARDIVLKSGTIHIEGVSFAAIYPSNALTIEGGDITVDAFATTYTNAYGVYARNGLFKMTGGKLKVDNQHNSGWGISASEIEIKGGSINAFGTLCGMEALKTDGNLTISGGRLTIGSRTNAAFYAGGNLLIRDGRLDVTTAAQGEPPISVRGNMRMTGGRVTAASTHATDPGTAIVCRKDVAITGGALTAIGGPMGIAAQCDLEIGETATVRAEGSNKALSSGVFPYQIRIGKTVYTGNDTQLHIVNGALVTAIEPVTDIVDLPTTATTGESLTLTGTVQPGNATAQTILWTINNDGGTSASIQNGVLTAVDPGTLSLTATVPSGKSATEDFEKDFDVTVMDRVATPTANPAGGNYTGAQRVTLSCATPGATIRYTTNGADPTAASAAYGSAIPVAGAMTIKAIAVAPGMTDSHMMSQTYAIDYPPAPPAAPTIATAVLPDGVATVAYSQVLSATGATPINWSLDSGALPDGLNLLSGGVVTGTPTKEGVYSFTVRASNAGGYDTRAFTIRIAPKLIPVTGLRIEPDGGALTVGETLKLEARISPDNATNQNVIWSSADVSVATVDGSGLVAAVGAGTTRIIAKSADGGHTAECKISVVEPEVLELNVNLLAIQKGKKLKLAGLTGFAGSWQSMDKDIAAIGKTGVLTAKQIGDTTLRFTVGIAQKGATFMDKALAVGDTVSIDLHVVKKGQAVKKLTVAPKKLTLAVAERLPLSASVSPKAAAYPQVFWRSRNKQIATVDANGVVTGVALGTAKIVATATNGQSRVITVTVSDELSAMELNLSKKKLAINETCQLSLKSFSPAALPAPTLTWTSGKERVATVDANGLVHAVGKGKTTVTATAPNGVKATCKITVQ